MALEVGGSSPLGHPFIDICRVRLGVRTPAFHAGNTGSNPVRGTLAIVMHRTVTASARGRAIAGEGCGHHANPSANTAALTAAHHQ